MEIINKDAFIASIIESREAGISTHCCGSDHCCVAPE
jgi:hypothetical protein